MTARLQLKPLLAHAARHALAVTILVAGAHHPVIALVGALALHLAAFAFTHDFTHGSLGLPERAPFDGILVTAGAPGLPPALLRQLRVGGQLVIPVGDAHSQRMVRVTREGPESFVREEFETFRFVPLLGASGWRG